MVSAMQASAARLPPASRTGANATAPPAATRNHRYLDLPLARRARASFPQAQCRPSRPTSTRKVAFHREQSENGEPAQAQADNDRGRAGCARCAPPLLRLFGLPRNVLLAGSDLKQFRLLYV